MQRREEDENAVDSEAKRNELEKSEGGEMLDDCSLKSAYGSSDGCCSGGEEEGRRDETTEGCRDETRKEVRISGEVGAHYSQ